MMMMIMMMMVVVMIVPSYTGGGRGITTHAQVLVGQSRYVRGASGMAAVLVNEVLVLEDGEYTSNVEGAYPGLVV